MTVGELKKLLDAIESADGHDERVVVLEEAGILGIACEDFVLDVCQAEVTEIDGSRQYAYGFDGDVEVLVIK